MKKAILFFVGCSLCTMASIAQSADAEKYAENITRGDLRKHLTIVASADMEGRETATEGQRKAAAYIESQFKLIGLKSAEKLKGYQMQYPLFKDTVTDVSLKIGKKTYEFGKDYLVMPLSAQTEKIKAKKLIFVGYGITDKNYDDYAGKDVKGKVVVFFMGEPKQGGNFIVSGTTKTSQWTFPGLNKKAALAKQNGAVAALVINPTMETIPPSSIPTARRTNVYYPRPVVLQEQRVNYASITRGVAKELFGETVFNDMVKKASESEELNAVNAEVKSKVSFIYKKTKVPYFSSNVLGYIEGTDLKDQYLFLTAHYDHLGKQGDRIFYGADDDGSGTVTVIEMAQAFAKAKAEGKGPRRTIVFMTVSGEEKGLWGSEYYSDNPVFPLEQTTADLNTDMIGRIDPGRKYGDSTNYVYVIGDDKLSSDLHPITQSVNTSSTKLELDGKFNDPKDPERIYYRSDHYNFARKGVPIIFYFDGIHKDYHRTTDTVDKINFDLMEKRARLIFLTAWNIANRDAMLKRDIPLPEGSTR